jgi:hypothetical protein
MMPVAGRMASRLEHAIFDRVQPNGAVGSESACRPPFVVAQVVNLRSVVVKESVRRR